MSKADPSPPYFRLRDVHTVLGERTILDGVSLDIPAARTTVVMGGSGTGKSVLLKHLNGLIRPDSGSIEVLSEEITGRSENELGHIRGRIGFVFQDGALFDSLTVSENILFPLRESGQKDETRLGEILDRLLEQVGLRGEADKLPARLSGGMRKRAALARALAGDPDCLLCDEPTAGLDPVLSDTVSQLIRKTTRDRELTAVVVTHDLGALEIMADHVVFMHEGTIRFAGPPDEFRESREEPIRAFFSAVAGGG